MDSVAVIRARLTELGYLPDSKDVSAVYNFQTKYGLDKDGVVGPNTTKQAVKLFQQATPGLKVDGIVGPKTLSALGLNKTSVAPKPGVTIPSYKWMNIGLEVLGLNEITNKTTLSEFLRSDGSTLGDPSKLPWCGDFVETCIKLAIPGITVPDNPYYARNWATWGKSIEPQYGAILVFVRDGGGHVGFYLGENSTSYLVLGGNQRNAVTRAYIDKDRFLASRFPNSFTGDGTRFQADEGGELSTNEA